MASLNKVMLIGRVGKDPESRMTKNDKMVVSFSVATSEKWKGQDGQQNEKTEWHNIEVWGNQTTAIMQYVHKGSQVHIEGSIKYEQWEDNGVKKYATKINAYSVIFLDSKGRDQQTQAQSQSQPQQQNQGQANQGYTQDDIPF